MGVDTFKPRPGGISPQEAELLNNLSKRVLEHPSQRRVKESDQFTAMQHLSYSAYLYTDDETTLLLGIGALAGRLNIPPARIIEWIGEFGLDEVVTAFLQLRPHVMRCQPWNELCQVIFDHLNGLRPQQGTWPNHRPAPEGWENSQAGPPNLNGFTRGNDGVNP